MNRDEWYAEAKYEKRLRAMFDFDNRKQERVEMEKSGEDETLLAQALQGFPACNRLRFHREESNYMVLDPKEVDKAITLGQKINGPRFPISAENTHCGATSLFNVFKLGLSLRKLGGIKNGCLKVIERTIEMGSRAMVSAGKSGIPNSKPGNLLSTIDAAEVWYKV